jgi:hypothetical protein
MCISQMRSNVRTTHDPSDVILPGTVWVITLTSDKAVRLLHQDPDKKPYQNKINVANASSNDLPFRVCAPKIAGLAQLHQCT